MGNLGMVLAAASVALAYGGSFGAERLMDRYGRSPVAESEQAASPFVPAEEERADDVEDR